MRGRLGDREREQRDRGEQSDELEFQVGGHGGLLVQWLVGASGYQLQCADASATGSANSAIVVSSPMSLSFRLVVMVGSLCSGWSVLRATSSNARTPRRPGARTARSW